MSDPYDPMIIHEKVYAHAKAIRAGAMPETEAQRQKFAEDLEVLADALLHATQPCN